jgi:rhodanese-related sulfurtransferase
MHSNESSRRDFVRILGTAATVAVAGCAESNADAESTLANETATTSIPSATQTTADRTGAENESTTDPTTSADTPDSTDAPEPTDTPGPTDVPTDAEGPRHGDDLPPDPKPLDGYPPAFEQVPSRRRIDASTFGEARIDLDGTTTRVPLVPVDVAYYWYARGEARMVDARSQAVYDVSRVYGSVLSPAPKGSPQNDPPRGWPASDRIVVYCDGPNYMSSLRAAALIRNGYDEVYAVEEGFRSWAELNYPMAGSDPGRTPTVHTIRGTADRQHAGGTVWAFHDGSQQRAAARIGADGGYEIDLRFVDVTGSSEISVRTPGYVVSGTLRELTRGTVTEDGPSASAAGTPRTGTETPAALIRRLF